MTHLPPDPDAAGDGIAADWQALLAGGAPPQRPAAPGRASSGGGQTGGRQADGMLGAPRAPRPGGAGPSIGSAPTPPGDGSAPQRPAASTPPPAGAPGAPGASGADPGAPSGRPLTRREAREAERRREAELHGAAQEEPAAEQWPAEPVPDEQWPAEPVPDEQWPAEPVQAEQWPAEPVPDEQWPADPAEHSGAPDAWATEEADPFAAVLAADTVVRPNADPRAESGFPFAVEPAAPTTGRPSRAERREMAAVDELHALHDEPNTPKRRRRGAWGCLIALLVVAALGAGAWFALQGPITAIIERFQPAADYSGQGTGEVLFSIEDGDTGTSIAARLVEEDIVASEEAFLEAIAAQGEAPTFYPGVYRMAQQMSAKAALDALLDETNRMENTVRFREGAWARDVLAEASAMLDMPIEDLEAAAADPQALGLPAEATSVEGFLFPAVYTFDPGVTAQEVVQTMVDRALQEYDAAGVAPEDRLRVATIASLVEREGLPQDFGKVSRVIQNRLDQGMLLQFDSTVHYGLGDDSVVTTTDAEREDASNPFNTYVHAGLPPGPIGNPGAAAIHAALNPEPGEWLYFVTVNPDTGETIFTNTIEEHEAAAEQFYQWLEDHPDDGD